jgi:hypothetical protein
MLLEALFAGVTADERKVRTDESKEDISIAPRHKQVSGKTIFMSTRGVRHAILQHLSELNF